MDQSSFNILTHNSLRTHNLVLVTHMSKHMKFKWLREEKIACILRKAHKFQKKSYSGIISFVYEGKGEIHKHMQYEVSVTVCMGRIVNQRKISKWLPFKNYKSESLNT